MIVYRSLDNALRAMKKESIRLREDVFLTYTRFGNSPIRVEFCLRTRGEMIDPETATNCIAVKKVNENEVRELWNEYTFEGCESYLDSDHKCGDGAMRGSRHSLDEVIFSKQV